MLVALIRFRSKIIALTKGEEEEKAENKSERVAPPLPWNDTVEGRALEVQRLSRLPHAFFARA